MLIITSLREMTSFVLAVEDASAEAEPKFSPFTGVGRRLDGKTLMHQPQPISSSGAKDKRLDAATSNAQPSAGSSSQSNTRQTQGKLVFGSNVNRTTSKETPKVLLMFHHLSSLKGGPIKTLTKKPLNNVFSLMQKEAGKESKQEQPPKTEEPKFQPFSGKKYSLRG